VESDEPVLGYAPRLRSRESATFLLSRIVGSVEPTGQSFPDEGGDHAARALAELDAIWANGVGVIEVTPGTDAAARLARRKGSAITADNHVTLHYSDMNLLADELAGYGPEVLVISPPWLRDAVRTRLEQTAEAHGWQAPAGGSADPQTSETPAVETTTAQTTADTGEQHG
jgi:predicted DNA-binding transcriptional regulator YafY